MQAAILSSFALLDEVGHHFVNKSMFIYWTFNVCNWKRFDTRETFQRLVLLEITYSIRKWVRVGINIH